MWFGWVVDDCLGVLLMIVKVIWMGLTLFGLDTFIVKQMVLPIV